MVIDLTPEEIVRGYKLVKRNGLYPIFCPLHLDVYHLGVPSGTFIVLENGCLMKADEDWLPLSLTAQQIEAFKLVAFPHVVHIREDWV